MSLLAKFAGLWALVIDDEETAREFLCDFLEAEGFHVDGAGTAPEGFERAEARRYDLIIVDKNLPGGDGLDIAREFGGQSAYTQIVMISGFATVDTTVEAIQLDIADFILKPIVDLDVLRARLHRVLERQSLLRLNAGLMDDLQRKNRDLEELVVRDPMTGLYNHSYFQEHLTREIQLSKRQNSSVSLALIDIDRFKLINDTHGHPAGDKVLQAFAMMLRGESHRFDLTFRLRREDMAARYGGDEFALVLSATGKLGSATKAERLRAAVAEMEVEGVEVEQITASVGLATFPEDAVGKDDLIEAADAALYASKRNGRNRITSYAPELAMGARSQAKALTLEKTLHDALRETIEQELVQFHYQPIVHATLRTIVGYEALCRPQHREFPNPVSLLEIAVRTGQIDELGRMLRRLALTAISDCPDHRDLFVNIHPQELNDEGLLDPSPELLEWAPRIVYEVTESSVIADLGKAGEQIAELRSKGFRVALDDLGSGYASMSALAQLGPDIVKLDMHFVRNLSQDERTARLVRHLIDYAHGEGMKVVAKGVETEKEFDAVVKLECDLLQGFYFAKPQPRFVEL